MAALEQDTHDKRNRRDWLIILLILLFGFMCILITSGWALRFAPNWRLDTSMESRLDPNSNFLTSRPIGFFEPLDPSILTQPAWADVFLTPGASFATRTPAPAPTSVNTAIPVTSTAKPPTTPLPTNTLVFFPSPTKTSVVSPPKTSTSVPPLPSANLQITKTDGITTYNAPGTRTYTIIVSNNGPSNVTGAVILDAKPSQVTTWTWVCTSQINGANGCTPASGSANFSDSVNLPNGASIVYTVTTNIASGASGNMVNTASVSAFGYTDPNNGNNSATDTDLLFVPSSVDLQITKDDGVTTYTAGGSVTYTIIVSNLLGPNAVTGATVTDAFPAQITSTNWTCSSSGGGTCTGTSSGNINDSVNLPIGASVTYTVTVNISAGATGDLVNTAQVAVPSGYSDPNTTNNSSTDTDKLYVPSADLSITKTDGATTYAPGSNVTYTITVSNSGPDAVTNATVTDSSLTSAPITSATWTCASAGGATCTTGLVSGNISDNVNIPVSGTLTYTVNVNTASSATGNLTNMASVAAPPGYTDPTPGNNSATDTDTPVPSANLGITKDDGATAYEAGGTTTYTIIVSNAGPSDVTGARVQDTFTMAFDSVNWTCTPSGAGAACGNGSGSGNIDELVNLPASTSVTYSATVNIAASETGNLTNTATVTEPSGVTDPVPGNNSASDPNPDELITSSGTTYDNIGTSSDNQSYTFNPADSSLVLTLSSPIIRDGNTDYDLVYYESAMGTGIYMDNVIIQISDGSNWYTILYWGDGNADTNSNISLTIIGGSETDNRDIPLSQLYLGSTTGVAIDIDSVTPNGTGPYKYIRIQSLSTGDGDGAQVDGIEVLPP